MEPIILRTMARELQERRRATLTKKFKKETAQSEVSRRNFFSLTAAGGAATAAALLGPAQAVAQDANCTPDLGSVAWKQPGNNEHVRKLQAEAKPGTAGQLVIDYFGHCAFRLTTPAGFTLLFDPWRNDPSGAWGLWFPKDFPRITVDAVLSTHTHFDHDAIDKVDATSILDRLVGTFSFADVTITGIADKHSTDQPGWFKWIDAVKGFGIDPYPPNNPGHLDNVSFVVETGGIRTLIWGDNRANPPEEVWKAWGRIDVLTLPVDGSAHILSAEQGNAIVDHLKPKVVIPTHYLLPGVTSGLTTLEPADAWVGQQKNKRLLTEPRIALTATDIEKLDRESFYFGDHATEA